MRSRSGLSIQAGMAVFGVLAVLQPALAQDFDMEFYGRAHVTVDALSDGEDSALNVSSNASRIGFRANTGVAPGIRAIMQAEQGVEFDNGAADLSSRDTWVGLEGGFGMLRLGFFDTPGKDLRSDVDLFNDQLGDARNLARLRDNFSGGDFDFDTRFRNGIHYRTPGLNNVSLDLHYSTNTDSGATAHGDNDALGTALTYRGERGYLGVSWERKNDTGSSSWRLGASRRFQQWRVLGFLQHATLEQTTLGGEQTVNNYGLGASYRLSAETLLKGQFLQLSADGEQRDARMLAMGADHRLSERFRLLFVYAWTGNDDNAAYAVSRGGHGAQLAPVIGGNPQGLSAGIRFDF